MKKSLPRYNDEELTHVNDERCGDTADASRWRAHPHSYVSQHRGVDFCGVGIHHSEGHGEGKLP